MTEEKLTSESLGNAVELITDTIYEAMDKLYPDKESWPHKQSVYEAWNLLIMFGDLDDNDYYRWEGDEICIPVQSSSWFGKMKTNLPNE